MIHKIQKSLQVLISLISALGRDMIYACRSLAKARSFTIVCVLSLGIGMGVMIALASFMRANMAPVPGVEVDGLVELLILPSGALRAKAGYWAIEEWSYPDFAELRSVDVGMAITGWAIGESQSRIQRSERGGPARVPAMFVTANYFSTVGISLARGSGFDPMIDDAASAQGTEPHVVLGYDFCRTSSVQIRPSSVKRLHLMDFLTWSWAWPPTVFMVTWTSIRFRKFSYSSP